MSLELKAKLEALITRREGLIAENRTRELGGNSPAYGEEHFWEIEREIEEVIKAIEEPRIND